MVNIPKLKKDVLVPLAISIAGCAIWAAFVWFTGQITGQITGFKIHRPTGFDIFQFLYITVIAFVGYFFGMHSKKAELSEVYADVILAWLKEHCHTVFTFTTEHMAGNVTLPVEKVSTGLQRLLKHELLIKKPLFWEYSAISAVSVQPGYKRITSPTAAIPPSIQSEILGTLPVYWQDLRIERLHFCTGVSFDSTLTFFLNLSIVSDTDIGIADIIATCKIKEQSYRIKPIDDLSEWILRTEIKFPEYPYHNTQKQSLDDVSLWKDLRRNGLKSAQVKTGWIGFTVADANSLKDTLEKLAVVISKPNQKQPYRLWIPDLTEPKEHPRIFDHSFLK